MPSVGPISTHMGKMQTVAAGTLRASAGTCLFSSPPRPNEQPSQYMDTRIESVLQIFVELGPPDKLDAPADRQLRTETRSPFTDILNRVLVSDSRISPHFSQRHLPPTRKIPYQYRELLAQRSWENLDSFPTTNNVFSWFVIVKAGRMLQCRFRLAAVHEATSSSESVLLKRKNWQSSVPRGTRNETPVSEIFSMIPPGQGAAVRFRRSLLFSKRSGNWGEFRQFKTAMNPGALVFNAYSLEHSRAVYEGQRAASSDKRVVNLTRSAYAESLPHLER